MAIYSKYKYIETRKEWMGIILDESDTILTIGCEQSESEIKKWLQKAMEAEPWVEGNPSVPDMYDRRVQH